MTTPNVPHPDDAALVERIMQSLSAQATFAGFGRSLRGAFEGHVYRTMEATVGNLNTVTGLSFNIPDHAARQMIGRGGTQLLGMDIAGQTRTSLFRALAEARAQGLHPSSAATRRMIQDHVTAGRFRRAGPKYRARLIARTETMHAQNESALAAYENSANVQLAEIVDDQLGVHGNSVCSERNGFVGPLDEVRRHVRQEHPNGTARVLPVVG